METVKILGICGSRVKEGNVSAFLDRALERAVKTQGVKVEKLELAGQKIGPCLHCNWCLTRQTENKFCAQPDDMSAIYPKLLGADGLLVASPVHFGRLSGLTADWMDRTRALIHGKTYRFPLRNKIGGAMAVAFFQGAGLETTLQSIVLFFLSHQMIVANGGGYPLGAGAFSSRGGLGRFEKEIRHMILEDAYGVAAAERLADRMVELAKMVKTGSRPAGSE